MGRDAKLFDHLIGAVGLVLHRVVHFDSGPDQLHQIFVGADHHDLVAAIGRFLGQGGDDVVSFKPRGGEHRNIHGGGELANQSKLGDEIFGRSVSVGLVEIVDFVPKGLLGGVKDHPQVGRLLIAEKLADHTGEADHGVGGEPLPGGEGSNGVIGSEDVPTTVN